MKIQKGIVKYKDREDIICSYGVTEDGRQYYFLDASDEKRLSNGNRIASTALVEAIDPMVKASNIGVIDNEGNEVIPFTNKAIRPINDNVILVELGTPISQNVIDTQSLKNDPLAATKLVSTSASIKEKLNHEMGSDGRFLFNDQFSEATICDINGNNLVDNEYFSFIGISGNKLYLSKNFVDSDIVLYSILPTEVVQSEENSASKIDVSDVAVEENVIEEALASGESEEELTHAIVDEDSSEVPSLPEENSVLGDVKLSEEAVQDSIPEEDVVIPTVVEEADTVSEESVTHEEVESSSESINVNETGGSLVGGDSTLEENELVSSDASEDVAVDSSDKEEEAIHLDDIFTESNKENSDELMEESDLTSEDSLEEDLFKDSMVQADSISTDFDDNFGDAEYGRNTSENLMGDVARLMSNLMNQNKELKSSLKASQERFEKANAFRKNLAEKAEIQEQKIATLTFRIRSLESRNQTLESRVQEQERTITSQARELNQGKERLVSLLADAKVLLNDDASYEYDNSDDYYRRVA